jgi:hypothetical protein
MALFPRALVVLLGLLAASGAAAQGFAAQVSPPRFEESAKAGTTFRNVLEITNDSNEAARFAFRTADWSLDAQGAAAFSYELAPGSCRPWVGIEAPEIQVPANGRKRYRFEVAVPADAPSGECRFAIMIEGDSAPLPGGGLQVAGRIGIIVYLTVGDGAPVLTHLGTRVASVNGRDLPLVSIRNSGNAHARLGGYLDAIDGNGKRITVSPSSDPILPGATREIALLPLGDGANAPEPTLTFPLRIKGRLEAPPLRLDIDDEVGQ